MFAFQTASSFNFLSIWSANNTALTDQDSIVDQFCCCFFSEIKVNCLHGWMKCLYDCCFKSAQTLDKLNQSKQCHAYNEFYFRQIREYFCYFGKWWRILSKYANVRAINIMLQCALFVQNMRNVLVNGFFFG